MWKCAVRLLHASSYACTLIVFAAFCMNYKTFNTPEYFLDTNYLHWTSPLPAVSFCQAFPSNSSDTRKEVFLKNLLRPEGVYCKECDIMQEDEFPQENYSAILFKYTKTCHELFDQCFWNGEPIDCCQRITEVFNSKSKCYTFNSHTLRDDMKFSVSHFAKDSILDVIVNAPVHISVHDPKALMFKAKQVPIPKRKTRLDILYMSSEIRVHQSAYDLTLKQRGCILQGEETLPNCAAYSESACMVECLIRNQMLFCNCTHHLLPNFENRPTCNKVGLLCLDKHFSDLRKPKFNKKRTKCKCRPACDEIEVKMIRSVLENTDFEDIRVRVQQSSPPTERLTLRARVEMLDIIVGIACFTRLFTSASYLGVVNRLLLRPDRRILQYYFYRQLLY